MSGTVYQAAAGAMLQQMRLDVLSNNLANVNTVGYKADKLAFRVDTTAMPQAAQVPAPQLSPYAPPLEHMVDFSVGPVRQTQNSLDLAIMGDGFFVVQSPNGLQYTRKGSFSINDQGQLSTADGWPVMGQGGPITIDGSRLVINDQGQIFVDDNQVGTLQIEDFARPYDLQKVGDTLFVPANDRVRSVPAEDYRIAQGSVELSNVEAIRTMTEIIETLRVFESYQRVMRAADDATAKTVNEVGAAV